MKPSREASSCWPFGFFIFSKHSSLFRSTEHWPFSHRKPSTCILIKPILHFFLFSFNPASVNFHISLATLSTNFLMLLPVKNMYKLSMNRSQSSVPSSPRPITLSTIIWQWSDTPSSPNHILVICCLEPLHGLVNVDNSLDLVSSRNWWKAAFRSRSAMNVTFWAFFRMSAILGNM